MIGLDMTWRRTRWLLVALILGTGCTEFAPDVDQDGGELLVDAPDATVDVALPSGADGGGDAVADDVGITVDQGDASSPDSDQGEDATEVPSETSDSAEQDAAVVPVGDSVVGPGDALELDTGDEGSGNDGDELSLIHI